MAGPFPARVTGPLAGQVEGFRAELRRLGYTERSAAAHLYALAHLSRWLEEEGLRPSRLADDVLERFVAGSQDRGPLPSALGRLPWAGRQLPPCERGGSADGSGAHLPLDRLLENYRRYLTVECRLDGTTISVTRRPRPQVPRRPRPGPSRLPEVTALGSAVVPVQHRLDEGPHEQPPFVARIPLSRRRPRPDLTGAVPAGASWRKTALPRASTARRSGAARQLRQNDGARSS